MVDSPINDELARLLSVLALGQMQIVNVLYPLIQRVRYGDVGVITSKDWEDADAAADRIFEQADQIIQRLRAHDS